MFESDLNQACISCLLNSENMKSLYDQFSTDMCVADVFVYVTSLEFTGDSDGLPTQICHNCYNELTLSYTFVTKCHKSHKTLQNHHKNATDLNQQTAPFQHVDIKLEIDEYTTDYETTPDPITTEIPPPEIQTDLDLEVIKHEIDNDNGDVDDYVNYKNESDAPVDIRAKMAAKINKMVARKRADAAMDAIPEVTIGVLNDCKQCDIQFATYELLLTHYRLIEHDTIAVGCRFCAESYEPKDLYDHTQTAHTNWDSDVTVDTCTVCGLRFDHKGNLKRHMATHTGEKPHVCDVCNKSFNRKESMTYHMLSHTGKQPYLFPVTDKFINKEQITHKVVQVKRTHYSCAICAKTFNHKGKVSRHMLTHTGQKPYSCDVCDKSFNQKENLARHILTHTGQKPHSCTVCERSFTHKENLTYHMITHSDDKPYACEHCDKSFVQQTKLNRHMLTHQTQRPYSCDVCDRTFIKIGNLNRHMATHTS